MKRHVLLGVSAALVGLGLLGSFLLRPAPAPEPPGEFSAEERERIFQHSPLGDPPPDPTNAFAGNPAAARLGQRIFFDPRFSKSGTVSCSTCHVPERGFGDGERVPSAFPIDRNVPTLWNVSFNRWFFWDGRADSLWSQALQPLENPKEQAGTRLQHAQLIRSDAALRAAYEEVFGPLPDLSDVARFPAEGGPGALPPGSPLHSAWTSMKESDQILVNRVFANLGKAVAAYERKLVSRRSPFDLFVEGLRSGDAAKMAALSGPARQGLRLFVGRANCRLCHSGPAFSDGEFHNLGIPPLRGAPAPGRFAAIDDVRKDPFNSKSPYSDDRRAGESKLDFLVRSADAMGQFKTPSLRNVARSAPYMHQGQFATLGDVLRFYSTLEGRVLTAHHEQTVLVPLMLQPDETRALIAFLESLTDEGVDPALLRPPPK